MNKKKRATPSTARAKTAGKLSSQDLTNEELADMCRYVDAHDHLTEETDIEEAMLRDPPSPHRFGQLAELKSVRIIHLVAEQMFHFWMIERESSSELPRVHRAIADVVVDAILTDQHDFFQELATLLRLNKAAKAEPYSGSTSDDNWVHPWAKLKLRDLGVTQKPGRKANPYNLKIAGRGAVLNCLARRLMGFDDWRATTKRVTREELKSEILKAQRQLGLKDAIAISDFALSRLITEMGIAKWMDYKRSKGPATEHRL